MFPQYDNAKPGWREWRKSFLSHIASSSVWLLHWVLKNLIALRLVTCSFWSRILIRCTGYVKLVSSDATLGNATSTDAFKHFFSCDAWDISLIPVNDGGNSSLYATFQCSEVTTFPSSQTSSLPSWVKPLGIHDLQPQTLRVNASCLHNSLSVTLWLLGYLECDWLSL
jgi:hypothetical protein